MVSQTTRLPLILSFRMLQSRNLEIIGEAARNVERVSPEFAAAHADVPWEDMYLMRNRVSHGYFSVDAGVIWQTIVRDLPVLKQQIAAIREQTP